RGIADRRFEAAAVASDILARMTADGDVQADAIRTVYESEPFPPGVIGYAHNLKSELRDKIRQTLLEFEWAGTGVEKEFKPQGAVKFAEVDYKRDWAPVRQVREAGGALLAQLSRP
ncbi:MAG TPA: PhnD/SsuA/transferrin family substrate-binding protein, partial [Lacipirellulaceae bacterium]|nr:PhnD/SsuA/transferrin family substrate-binding protein [Lacipirellulaceae bacterium]